MSKLSESEVDEAPVQASREPQRGVGGDPAHGDVDGHAEMLRQAGGNRGPMLQQLHATFGNAFVMEVLGRLEQGIGTLPADRPGAIAKLDDAARTQLADVDARVATAGAGTGGPLVKAVPATVSASPDRAIQEAKIRAAGSKERGELDTALDGELASLDRVMGAEVARIDHQADAQLRAVDAAAAEDQKHLDQGVTSNDHANAEQVAGAKTSRDAEVATQKAHLHETADSERGWHQATRDQILDEDVNPHVTANTAAVKANAAAQPGAARSVGAIIGGQGKTAVQKTEAKAITDHEAAAVEAEGARATKQVTDDGAAVVAKQNKRTDAAVTDLTKEEGRQGARIDSASGRAASEMKGIAAKAHADMAAASGDFTSQAAGSGTSARETIEAERAASKARAAQLQRETATRLRDLHAKEMTEVDTKVLQLLGELSATPDAELHRKEAHFTKELKKLDGIDRATESSMHVKAVGAENTLADEDQQHSASINAAGTQARAAIAAFYDEAKKQIAATEKPADAALSTAAKRGREKVAAVGADAAKDFTTFSEARQSKDVAASAKDLAAFDTSANAANMNLATMASGVAGKIGNQWADDAMPEVTAAFDKGNALAGMRALVALPPAAQGPAIGKLTGAQFQALLTSIPDGNRDELATLVQNTHDAQRKLKLWGVYHKAHAMHDAQNDGAKADTESQRRHAARMNAATTTGGEVDDEVSFLQHQGKPFNETDVNKLIARKDKEHAMEMQYNLNFTNDTTLRKDKSHVHWEKDQLEALDSVMSRMPEDHMAGNANLTEIHRQENVYWGDPKNNVKIGGLATGTQVLIPDNGVDTKPSGEKRQLAPGTLTPEVSWMEWLITHELGHNVSNKHGDIYEKYRGANGWESYPKDTDKLTAVEKTKLEEGRTKDHTQRQHIDKDGKTFLIDQQGDGYISFTQGALPDKSDSQKGAIGGDDPWSYARTRDFEQFAEHYDRAMHVPEKVWIDLIKTPRDEVAAAQAVFDKATAPDDKKAAGDALQQKLKMQKARKDSFYIMRDEIYGTATAQQGAEERLRKAGADTAKIEKFKEEAQHASTPDQLEVIEAKYR